ISYCSHHTSKRQTNDRRVSGPFFFQTFRHLPDLHSFPTRRSSDLIAHLLCLASDPKPADVFLDPMAGSGAIAWERAKAFPYAQRSEEHTSELQSLAYLVCRLLLEKKKTHQGLKTHQRVDAS